MALYTNGFSASVPKLPTQMGSLNKLVTNISLLGTFKGPKREIFDFGVFAQIRPLWIGDLGTRPKNYKFLWFRHENRHFILISAVAYNAKKL